MSGSPWHVRISAPFLLGAIVRGLIFQLEAGNEQSETLCRPFSSVIAQLARNSAFGMPSSGFIGSLLGCALCRFSPSSSSSSSISSSCALSFFLLNAPRMRRALGQASEKEGGAGTTEINPDEDALSSLSECICQSEIRFPCAQVECRILLIGSWPSDVSQLSLKRAT